MSRTGVVLLQGIVWEWTNKDPSVQDTGKSRDGGSIAQTGIGGTSGTGIVAANDDDDEREREYTQTQTRHVLGNETTGIDTSFSLALVKGSGEREVPLPKVRLLSFSCRCTRHTSGSLSIRVLCRVSDPQ